MSVQTMQADIKAEERAIRHLLGEEAALDSKIKREEAKLKLEESRLKKAEQVNHQPGPGFADIPHGNRFPDFSNNQPNVDVKQIHEAHGEKVGLLAFTKLTEGTGFVDHPGVVRLDQMKAIGFKHRGAYHFGHPSEGGVAQAQHFLNSGGAKLTAEDIACYDCEVSDGQGHVNVAACARQFAEEVRKHTPAKLWLYGGGPFLKHYGVTLDGYDGHWLAAYVGNPNPYMVYGAGRTVAWQYTDGHYGPTPHACPGIGNCDMSIIL